MHMCKQFYISFKIILNNRFFVFKIQGLYCNELIFCKLVNLQKPRYGTKVRMRVIGAQGRTGSLKYGQFDKQKKGRKTFSGLFSKIYVGKGE